MKNMKIMQGAAALSLAALMVVPPAGATQAIPPAENTVTVAGSSTQGTASEVTQESFAAATAVAAINLNVNLGTGLLAQLDLKLDTTYKDQVIQQIKDLRGKAWGDTSLPFQPFSGSKDPMSLQAYLKSQGITTKKQYQDMVKWDANLERTALQRLYETNIYWDHDRTNGSDTYTATNGVIRVDQGENIYGASGVTAAMEAWSTEPSPYADNKSEWDWLKENKGEWGFYQGHLWSILNPDSKSFALATGGSSTVLSMSPETPKNQTGLNFHGTYTGQITLKPELLSAYAIKTTNNLTVGQTSRATTVATKYLKPSWVDYYLKPTTLAGTWSSSNPSVVKVDATGQVTAVGTGSATIKFTPTYINDKGAKVLYSSSLTQSVTVQRFSDVPNNRAFANEINWMANSGITTGYSDGTYRPLADVERGAMAAFFYRMAGSPSYTPPKVSPFKDVPTTHQFYKEISWLASKGITTGYSDGTFRPDDHINRDAIAAFFYRYAGQPSYTAPANSMFNDIHAGDKFYKEVSWLASQNITTGWPDGGFHPLENVHRDAMAAFFYRYNQKFPRK